MKVMESKEIAEFLKECRLKKGLSQEQMAQRLYIDQAIVSKIENGKIQPAYSLVKQWAVVTDSKELLAEDIAGGNWRKQRQMESTLSQMKNLLSSVNFMRIKRR